MNTRSLIAMTRGDSRTLTFTVLDAAGDPVDLTDGEAWMTVEGLFEKSVGSGITLTDPTDGVLEVEIDEADTDGSSNWREAHRYDVQVRTASGETRTPFKGLFVVWPDVTEA
jgi:hypothetical protein